MKLHATLSWPALAMTAPLLLSAQCATTPVGDDTASTADLPYCEKASDFDTHYLETGTSSSTSSGKLFGRMVTDKSDDIHDPNYVAYVEYTLYSLDSGGSQLVNETDVDGAVVETLGAGSWRIKVSTSKQGYSCSNQYDLSITAGDTTWLCLDIGCR